MDNELIFSEDVHLYEAADNPHLSTGGMMEVGALILCRQGSAKVSVNYKTWALPSDGVISLFPGDIVSMPERTEDFSADVLTYSPAILREASLDMEQTVYQSLKEDRCRGDSHIVTDIVSSMFNLLKAYFRQPECTCLNRLVTFQLKAFFIGFHDYLMRYPELAPAMTDSKRKRSLFNRFMTMIEKDYRRCRDVNYYADALHISPKYLNIISKTVSSHRAKSIIDHYVILKLKISLTDSDKSIKQLSWDYNFSDASFFTRYFKQHTGMTPIEYRKSGISPNKKGRLPMMETVRHKS